MDRFAEKPYKPTLNLPFLTKLPADDDKASEPVPEHISQLLKEINLNIAEKSKLFSDFNYKRFNEYLRWKVSQKLKRENDYQQQQDLIVNENVVKRELSEMYGKMDEGHHDYSWILKKFKSNRIQQINDILQGFQEKDNKTEKDDYFEKDIIFTKNEIDMFEFISKGPDYSKIEPFMLPRPKEAKSSLTAISIDPTSSILFNVSQLIKKYPYGISLSQFIVKYQELYDHTGRIFTPEIFKQAEKSSRVFVQSLKGHQIKILFPHSLKKYIATPDKILNKILHMFEILLKLEFNESGLEDQPSASITELVSAFEDLMKDFPIRDLITDWGFTSFNQFAEILAASGSNDLSSSNSNSNTQLVKAKPPSKKQQKRNIEVDEEHRFQFVPSSSTSSSLSPTGTGNSAKVNSNPQTQTQKSGKTQELSSKSQSQPAVVQSQSQTKSASKQQQQKKQQQQQQSNPTHPKDQDQDQNRKKKSGNKGRFFSAQDDDFPAL